MPLELLKMGNSGVFPLPAGFKSANGVCFAAFASAKDVPHLFRSPGSKTQAQKNGKRYEKKVGRAAEEVFTTVLNGPWIVYSDSLGYDRYCQPDLLVLEGEHVIIFEAKSRHTVKAWFQLRRCYEPVVKFLYPGRHVSVVEVTSVFDSRLPWPEDIMLCDTFADCRKLNGEFGVLQWRK